jgi:hypothetical protein
MAKRLLAGMVCSLVVGCGGGGGGGGAGPKSCADVFTTPANYGGQEVVVGCYVPGTYNITASISQTTGTCNAQLNWQAASGSSHACAATLSGDATSGYDLDFSGCSLPGAIHVPPDLSTFTGHFNWTVTCGSGTTTFQDIAKK